MEYMGIQNFLSKSGMTHLPKKLADFEKSIKGNIELFEEILKSQTTEIRNSDELYVYQVPKTVEGVCSLEYGLQPFDLRTVMGKENSSDIALLQTLKVLIDHCTSTTKVNWLGVYKKYGSSLIKLSYRGVESRPEFPLNDPGFSSNNVDVGRSGKAILINDIPLHIEQGKSYYKCDAKVNSEACLPIFTEDGRVWGILDAEDHKKGFFDHRVLVELISLCVFIGQKAS